MTKNQLLEEYINTFTELEKKAYEIAKRELETSFDIEKSIGFKAFLKSRGIKEENDVSKKKVKKRKEGDGPEIKLYDFADGNEIVEEDSEEEGKKKDKKSFVIQMFGMDMEGKTYSVRVMNYQPFIYVKVGDEWTMRDKSYFMELLQKEVGGYYEDSIIEIKLLKKHKLYGFDGRKRHKFMKIVFKNTSVMNKIKNLWYDNANDWANKKLKKYGYQLKTGKYKGTFLKLYGATLPPLLRYFHIQDISPSGWIKLNKAKQTYNKSTIQDYEYEINYNDIISLMEKDDQVPLRIASWDIECKSSHGDFPLAKKTYTKLAMEIITKIINKEIINEEEIKENIRTAFNYGSENGISEIYTKKYISKEILEKKLKSMDDIKLNGLLEIKNDNERKENIKRLTTILKKIGPVKGDPITMIGTTFVKLGEEEQYKNDICVVGECSDIKEVPNRRIRCHKTEKELLIKWAQMIRNENPQMLIGYNVFAFDWSYILDRAEELHCKDDIMRELSINIEESAKVKKSTTKVASGTHDLTYIKMKGRLQLDLYNHFRKTENLSSYKLDSVASEFISDKVKDYEWIEEKKMTRIVSKNLMGLKDGDYISFKILKYSMDMYKNGAKFIVNDVDREKGEYYIKEKLDINKGNKILWGLNKDDITLEEMFNADTPDKRAKVAKYCLQDCNLVHNLMIKNDMYLDFSEMAKLCYVPVDFIIMRGQGIKSLSFISKKCRDEDILIPAIRQGGREGYEGAVVLEPKVGYYADVPVAVNDYSSLYPSSMISENLSPDSKVWTIEYDMKGNVKEKWGEKNGVYDNLPGYKYVDVTYDTYKYVMKKKARETSPDVWEKIKVGRKTCRFAQFPDDKKGILPKVLMELLAQRKVYKKKKKEAKTPFEKKLYDKRQLATKLTANSLYGQCGAKTSAIYEIDIAAATTAVGRKLLGYAKEIVEGCYGDKIVNTKHGEMKTNAEYVYGDTDSVFFVFNLKDMKGNKIVGKKALDVTIELAKRAEHLATNLLKDPHTLEYEKTFDPLLLLTKKRYVGMLYEEDINSGYRKEMGIVLKRRDNAPCVKDSYGGVVDILMKENNIDKSVEFLEKYLLNLINGKIDINKLILSKSLRAYYKNPQGIAHWVLAERMEAREPGTRPAVGSRIPYVYIKTKTKKKLQGDRIEHPDYIKKNNLKPDYNHYITNQIMKPLLQLFSLILEKLTKFQSKKLKYFSEIRKIKRKYKDDNIKMAEKIIKFKEDQVYKIIFAPILKKYESINKKAMYNNFFKV